MVPKDPLASAAQGALLLQTNHEDNARLQYIRLRHPANMATSLFFQRCFSPCLPEILETMARSQYLRN